MGCSVENAWLSCVYDLHHASLGENVDYLRL